MSKYDKVAKLIEKCNNLQSQLDSAKAELKASVNDFDDAPAATKPAKKSKKTSSKPQKASVASADASTDAHYGMKEVVTEVLQGGPASMEGIVGKFKFDEATKEWIYGTYRSKAKKLTPVVSQALFQLRNEKLVAAEKQPDQDGKNKTFYSLKAA